MTLHQQLKLETQTLHHLTENTPFLKKLTSKNITLNDYLRVIMKFYGFIAPCEMQFNRSNNLDILAGREKSSLLEQDLSDLGFDVNTYASVPHCPQLPIISKYEQILGYLYVIEGSTLGGQIITQHLKKSLNISDNCAAHFFYCYGKKTTIMWESFCQRLNKVNDSTRQEIIIHSAKSTYTLLYEWMLN